MERLYLVPSLVSYAQVDTKAVEKLHKLLYRMNGCLRKMLYKLCFIPALMVGTHFGPVHAGESQFQRLCREPFL